LIDLFQGHCVQGLLWVKHAHHGLLVDPDFVAELLDHLFEFQDLSHLLAAQALDLVGAGF